MKIRVKLYSFFVFLSGNTEGIMEVETDNALSVQELLLRCGVSKDYTALVRLNGKNININYSDSISEGDYLEVFPVFGGG